MNNLLMSAIMPHPPIMIEEVGGNEIKNVETTIKGAFELSRKIVSKSPELLIIVTPHSDFSYRHFSIYNSDKYTGSMAQFGAGHLKLNFSGDKLFVKKLISLTENTLGGINVLPESLPLDHGSFVPLYFLNKAGLKSDICVINYCGLDKETHIKFGEILHETINEHGRKTVFIASGDLSHRLKPSAPAGFSPVAHNFDEQIVDLIKKGDYQEIININEGLRYEAGECAYNSLMVAFGVTNKKPLNNKIYSYEAPYGVGYLVAEL